MDGSPLSGLGARIIGDLAQYLKFGFEAEAAPGQFAVLGFEAHEAVNAVPEVHLDLASHMPDIDLHALMDTDAVLSIHDSRDGVSGLTPRFLAGVVTEAERGESGLRRTFYSLTLRGALHRLAHVVDSRIWQDVTVVDIAQEVLADHGITRVDWVLTYPERYKKREFATQYREDCLSFLIRLLNEEGIYFYHRHAADGLTVVFTDASDTAPQVAQPVLAHNATSGGQSRAASVQAFRQRERLRSSTYRLNDYSYHSPAASYAMSRSMQESNGLKGRYTVYDPDGRYKDPHGVGAHFVRNRIEALRVDATTGHGISDAIHLSAGHTFVLTDHPDPKANDGHFLLSVTHSGTQSAALEEDAGSGPTTYSASFVTMPSRLPYRPPTPAKPVVDGPQIAIVTGPPGEEIHTDADGRVKVWFPWDYRAREAAGGDIGKIDDTSSCWIRVAQNWAGGGWGQMSIPRIGQECICEFLDGDIDQPIITGRTYHGANRPPYALPEHKTRMTIRSKSHKAAGFNELRFEDEAGREEVFIHAQKDRNEKTRNNHTERIDNNWVQSVGRNYVSQVDLNRGDYVVGSYRISVGPSGSSKPVSLNESSAKEGMGAIPYHHRVEDYTGPPEGDFSLQVHRDRTERIGGSDTETVSKEKSMSIGGRLSVKSDADITIDAGEGMALDSDKSLSINSGQSIQLSSGASSIVLNKDGTILIKAKRVLLDADELAELEAGTLISLESAKIKLN